MSIRLLFERGVAGHTAIQVSSRVVVGDKEDEDGVKCWQTGFDAFDGSFPRPTPVSP